MKHYLPTGILFYCLFLSISSAAQQPRSSFPNTANNSQNKYDSIRPNHDGFAAVSRENKWGFIDAAGKEIIAPQYSTVSDFIEDNAIVYAGRWIMIDTTGRFVKESYERQAQRYIDASKPFTRDTRHVPEIMYKPTNAAARSTAATTATTCPPNIDFEFGNFSNWYCFKGLVTTVGGLNSITWFNNNPPVNTPTNGRHTMITATTPSAMDPYGNFPINPPDGSGHAIRLGNDRVNDSAEKVRYILTVPTNAVDYSVSFQYAVVLENPTGGTAHTAEQKPRLIARVINAATNTVVQCADFLYVAAGTIPGFYNSTVDPNVKCKAWTPVFVNLSGYPGQTMYIEFTTADCTLGAHFGYGYLDVGPCSQPVITQYQCTPANSVTFTGPGDFQTYNWYNETYTTILGTSSTLIMSPPPTNGVVLHLELIPFNGSTCMDTLDVTVNSPLPAADAGPPISLCPGGSVVIGTAAVTGSTYQWSPPTYLSNAQVAMPTSTATQSTTYILTVTGSNGCTAKDTTDVTVNPVPVSDFTVNNTDQCIGQNSYVFQNASSISAGTYTLAWDFGDGGTSTALTPTHVYTTAGPYTVTLTATSNNSCVNIKTRTINVLPKPTVVSSTATNAQCLSGNIFSFSNGSTSSVSPLTYAWTFGDGGTSTATTPTHQYAAAGSYTVKLVVSTPAGCKDSVSYPVSVNPMPVSDFSVNTLSQCIAQNNFSFQNGTTLSSGTYTLDWTFGDGGTSIATNPSHTYSSPGSYSVRLIATSNGGCKDTMTHPVQVLEKPTVAFAPNSGSQCITNNSFVFSNNSTASVGPLTYSWSFGDGGISSSPTPTHQYASAGTFTVKLVVTTPAGCKDSLLSTVTVMPEPSAIAGADASVCPGTTITIGSAGIAGNTYQWTPATLLSDPQSPNPSLTPTQHMIYSLLVTGANGCTATDVVEVFMNPGNGLYGKYAKPMYQSKYF